MKTTLTPISPAARTFSDLLAPASTEAIESMAGRARAITRRHFGKTISLYVPLYLSDHCTSGCAYCGFSSDRDQPRHKLDDDAMTREMDAIKAMGVDDVLLLTGDRSPEADFDYVLNAVSKASRRFHNVTVESFAMTTDEYRQLGQAGCSGITLYQETYDPELYEQLHRWGNKRDYAFRREAPARALEANLRSVGMGVLLGLSDPSHETMALFQHMESLRKRFWRAGLSISFPRICAQRGDFKPRHEITDSYLAQLIFAFRICLPDIPLVLSTRESSGFRDGMAGLGISRMSVASRTTVGGYGGLPTSDSKQFDINDDRNITDFCEALKQKGLEPVFKNWDAIFQHAGTKG